MQSEQLPLTAREQKLIESGFHISMRDSTAAETDDKSGMVTGEEVRALFASVGWKNEAQFTDEQIDQAFNHSFKLLTARDNEGKLIGCIRTVFDGIYVQLWNLVVNPQYQKQGLGSYLYDRMVSELLQQGHRNIVGIALKSKMTIYTKGIIMQEVPGLGVISTNPRL